MSFDITLFVLSATLIANMFLLGAVLRGGWRRRIIQVFVIHLVAVIGWALGILLLLVKSQHEAFPLYVAGSDGYTLTKVVFFFAALMVATNFWFVEYFRWGVARLSLLNVVIGLLQLVTLVLTLVNNALYSDVLVRLDGYVLLTIEPLNSVYGVFLLSHFTIPLTLLYWYGKKETKSDKKKQYKILFISYLLFLITSMLFNWILPIYFNIFNFNSWGPITSLIVVGGIAYSIMRYHFLDIWLIVQRGTIYTVLFAFIASVYLSLLSLLGTVIGDERIGVATAGLLTTIIGVFSVPKLDSYLREKTDRIFFKGKYNYPEVIASLSGVLNKNLNERTIIKKSSQILVEALKSSAVVFVLGKGAVPQEVILKLPINSASKKIGQLGLGAKRSGQPYTKEDISLLTTFASQAGVALEKARLFDEVKDYASTLEKRVDERTAEVVALQKEQEAMMHEISHGLQTPLTIMKGELFMLRKQGYEVSGIDNIDSSINRISLFINKLLSLYRLERSVVTKPKNIELRELANAVASSFSGVCSDKNISCTISAKKDYKVKGDYNELEEVLSNLVSNAIKYSSPDRPNNIEITIEGAKKEVIIKVSDTGLGIRPEEVKKLFTKFYRVRDADTKYIQGTGLGLVICKKVVEKYGGSIGVESEIGVGTTFIIKLPRVNTGSRK